MGLAQRKSTRIKEIRMIKKIQSINPFTGDVMNEFKLLSPKKNQW